MSKNYSCRFPYKNQRSLKHDVKFIINRNGVLAEYKLKKIWRLLYEHKEELNYLFKSLNYV